MTLRQVQIGLQTLTPMFLNGSDSKGSPEPRAASVRGQLRYWFRAMEGAKTADLKALWEAEQAIFGSTARGSVASIRLFRTGGALDIEQSPMLPHRQHGPQSPQLAIQPRQIFTLESMTRPGQGHPPGLINALKLWLLVGGLGKRSRRMFGALRNNTSDLNADTPQDYANLVKNLLAKAIGQPSPASGAHVPGFPTLHPAHSRIVVSAVGYPSWEQAYSALFTLLHKAAYSHNDVFGRAMGGRRASPLTAQVRLIADKYHPVLTGMRSSSPRFEGVDWNLLSQFLAEPVWQGITAWGTL